jgi:membrane-associated protease RseP (regulator of RpoE activity)
MPYLIVFASVLITIVLHESGHAVCAVLCKVKVEVFSVGFWKPFLSFKWKGIEWRITLWLLGGFCKLSGENSKVKNGFLVQPYRKKLLIILGGVFVNFVIAILCYLINYGNIFVGLKFDWLALHVFFTQDFEVIVPYYIVYRPNFFLWQLSFMNICCAVVNLIPVPSTDGSYIFLPWLEYVWKENYVKYLNITTKIGFAFLMILQVIIIAWMFI